MFNKRKSPFDYLKHTKSIRCLAELEKRNEPKINIVKIDKEYEKKNHGDEIQDEWETIHDVLLEKFMIFVLDDDFSEINK